MCGDPLDGAAIHLLPIEARAGIWEWNFLVEQAGMSDRAAVAGGCCGPNLREGRAAAEPTEAGMPERRRPLQRH